MHFFARWICGSKKYPYSPSGSHWNLRGVAVSYTRVFKENDDPIEVEFLEGNE